MGLLYLVRSGDVMGEYFKMSCGVTPPNFARSKGFRAVGQKRGEVFRRLLH